MSQAKKQAIKDLERLDQDLIVPSVDLKKVKQFVANGVIDDQQFKSLSIRRIEPKIKVKAKED